jgi:hypothetical protein
MAICKLCRTDRQLIKAHIIPQSFYAPASSDGVAKILSNTKGVWPKKTPIGVYDENILCADCDGKLGELDQHAAEQLLQNGPTKTIQTTEPDSKVIARCYETADPGKLLLFIASVVWRASVSSHDFFSRVELGPYEAIIRAMLQGKDRDSPRVQALLAEFDKSNTATLDPHSTRTDGVRFWVVYARQFVFYLKLDSQAMPAALTELSIEPGKPIISVVRDWNGSKEMAVMQKIVLANPAAFPKKAF